MKRPSCDPPTAELLILSNGTFRIINSTTDFFIGRSLTCDLVIHEIYISRLHCAITYKNGVFMIYDNNSALGVYINNSKLPVGKDSAQKLNDGDVICFGQAGELSHFYKFYLSTATHNAKVPKMEEVPSTETIETQADNSLSDENTHLIDQKIETLESNTSESNTSESNTSESNNSLDYYQNKINEMEEAFKKEKQKLISTIEELENNTSTQICEFQNKLRSILENDMQCPICNEIICKASTANCSHSFCELCIDSWILKSKICPICRAPINKILKTISLDSFITNICDFIGGSVKEQRDVVLNERAPKQMPRQTARRGRKARRCTARIPQQRLQNIIVDLVNNFENRRFTGEHQNNNTFAYENIEIVDLTDQSPP